MNFTGLSPLSSSSSDNMNFTRVSSLSSSSSSGRNIATQEANPYSVFSDVLSSLEESLENVDSNVPYPKLTALLQFLELKENINFSEACLGSLTGHQGFTADSLESVPYIDSLLIVTKDLSLDGFVNAPVDMDPNEEFRVKLNQYRRPMPFRWSNGVVPFKGHTFYMGLVHSWLDCWVVFEPKTPRDCDHEQKESAISIRSAQLFYEMILKSLSNVPSEVLTGNNVSYCRREKSSCDDESEQWEGLHAKDSEFVSSLHEAEVSFRISALREFGTGLRTVYSESNEYFFKEHVPKLYMLKFGQNVPIAEEQESILNYLTRTVNLDQIERTTVAIAHNVKLGAGLKEKCRSLLERQTAMEESEDYSIDSTGHKKFASLLERQMTESVEDSGDSNGLQEYTSLQERQMAITLPESGVLEYFGQNRASLKLFRKAFSPSFCNFQSKGNMPSAVKEAQDCLNALNEQPFCKIWGMQGYTTEANTIRPSENRFPFGNDIISRVLTGDRKAGGMQAVQDELTLLGNRTSPFRQQDVHYRVEFYTDFNLNSLRIDAQEAFHRLREMLGKLSKNLVYNHGQVHDTDLFPGCIDQMVKCFYSAIEEPLSDAHTNQSLSIGQAEIVAAVEQLIKACITGNPRFLAGDFFEQSGVNLNAAQLGFPWVNQNVFDPPSSTVHGDFLNLLAKHKPLVGQVHWRYTNKLQRLSELASVKFKMAVESHKHLAATSAASFYRDFIKKIFMNDMSLFLLAITDKKNRGSSMIFSRSQVLVLKGTQGLETFQVVDEYIGNSTERATITLGQMFDTFFRPVINNGVANPAFVRSWMTWPKTLAWLAQMLRQSITFDASWALTYFKEALAETLPVFLNSQGKLLTKFGQFATVVNETIGNYIHTGDAAEELRQAGVKSVDISVASSQRKDLKAAHKACPHLAPGNTSWEKLFYLPFKGEVNVNIPNVLRGKTGLIENLGLVFERQVHILGYNAVKLEPNWLKFIHFAVVLFACFQHRVSTRQKQLEIMDKLKVVPRYAGTLFVAALEKLKLVNIAELSKWAKLKENNGINDALVNRLLKPGQPTPLFEARYFDINLVYRA